MDKFDTPYCPDIAELRNIPNQQATRRGVRQHRTGSDKDWVVIHVDECCTTWVVLDCNEKCNLYTMPEFAPK